MDSNETTFVKIEIYFEENPRVVNVLDVPLNQKVDIENFNSDNYIEIISNDQFHKQTREYIEKSDSWCYDIHQTDLEIMGQEYYDNWDMQMNIDYIKSCLKSTPIMVRIIGVGRLNLSFLSVVYDEGNKNKYRENFLKGSIYECDINDDDFEDHFNEFMCQEALLSLDYLLQDEL